MAPGLNAGPRRGADTQIEPAPAGRLHELVTAGWNGAGSPGGAKGLHHGDRDPAPGRDRDARRRGPGADLRVARRPCRGQRCASAPLTFRSLDSARLERALRALHLDQDRRRDHRSRHRRRQHRRLARLVDEQAAVDVLLGRTGATREPRESGAGERFISSGNEAAVKRPADHAASVAAWRWSARPSSRRGYRPRVAAPSIVS